MRQNCMPSIVTEMYKAYPFKNLSDVADSAIERNDRETFAKTVGSMSMYDEECDTTHAREYEQRYVDQMKMPNTNDPTAILNYTKYEMDFAAANVSTRMRDRIRDWFREQIPTEILRRANWSIVRTWHDMVTPQKMNDAISLDVANLDTQHLHQYIDDMAEWMPRESIHDRIRNIPPDELIQSIITHYTTTEADARFTILCHSHTSNMDLFEQTLMNSAARRLLNDTTYDEYVVKHLDHGTFRRKIEAMIQDVRGRDRNAHNAVIARAQHWPVAPLPIPKFMQQQQQCTVPAREGSTICVGNAVSTVTMQMDDERKTRLKLTPYQAAFVLAACEKGGCTIGSVCDENNVKLDDVVSDVFSLVHPDQRVLDKNPNTAVISSTDRLRMTRSKKPLPRRLRLMRPKRKIDAAAERDALERKTDANETPFVRRLFGS